MQPDDKKKNDDFIWWLIIFILLMNLSSKGEPQALVRPDTGQAAARAIIARSDSATGRIGGRSRHKYSHSIYETEAPSIKTTMESWTMQPGRVFTRMTMPGSGFVEIGYNGTVGWTNSPMTGPVLMEGDALKQLIDQAQDRERLYGALKKLSAGARTVIEGREVVPVSFEDRKGNTGILYFDIKTGLLHATRVNASAHPDSATLVIASDYKRVDGELFALTTTIKLMQYVMVTRTTHLDHEAVDTARFIPPASLREQLKRP